MNDETQKLPPNRQVIVKRYEASFGFILMMIALMLTVTVLCYMTTLVAYATLESAEGVLGTRSGLEIEAPPALEPALIIPTPLPTSVPLIPDIAPTVTISGTGVITP